MKTTDSDSDSDSDATRPHTPTPTPTPISISIRSVRDGTGRTAFTTRTGNATVGDDGVDVDVVVVSVVVVVFANARRIVTWEQREERSRARGLWGDDDAFDSAVVREQETGEIEGVAREEIGERWERFGVDRGSGESGGDDERKQNDLSRGVDAERRARGGGDVDGGGIERV